jgi:uncharacterized LabA/DUF88 family protein
MSDKMRVRIFVDFWNLQIQWNELHQKAGAKDRIAIPWKDLPQVLCAEVSKGQPIKFTGVAVYASINPTSPKDRGLNNYLHHVLASYTGYSVIVKERKPRKTIRCQEENCKAPVTSCPSCKVPLKGTSEKGIDAAIITDLLSLAFDDNYDIAILISGDADYAPAVEYIQKKTDKQIIQAFFKAHGDELRNKCWDHLFFEDLLPKLLPSAAPSSAAVKSN